MGLAILLSTIYRTNSIISELRGEKQDCQTDTAVGTAVVVEKPALN